MGLFDFARSIAATNAAELDRALDSLGSLPEEAQDEDAA